ncbi:hypothetical protein QBC37DRAFT_441498 [Rhypophila decipiens]|uniref:Uncharacterized protein n=1 Tax=Rhypophila decipiens TaxID=261697 RepID=A0AAN6Y433_9PEZI|nr:hypothetical protein QBC37DRAFT_441498 [Rhypophila decipiens]
MPECPGCISSGPTTSLSAQWGVETTVNGALVFGQNLVQVATSDNVQILALAACELFGGTIAMSPATIERIQRDVIPPSPSPLVKFAKLKIGWSKDDCAMFFGSSEAGLRFLGLAAALVTTMGPLDAARAVSLMLRAVAKDANHIPPTQHVKELLASLEPRLTRSLFPEIVGGWHSMAFTQLSENARAAYESSYPSHEGISTILDALRKLNRVGEASIKKAKIQVSVECLPWVVAFTEWCLGVPPAVFSRDETPLLQPPGSNVDIFTGSADDRRLIVTLEHDLPIGPEELIAAEDHPNPCSGMVTVSTYGHLLRQKWRIDETSQEQGMGPAFRAFVSCVEYAAGRFLSECRFTSHQADKGPHHSVGILKAKGVKGLENCQTSPFSDSSGNTLARVLTRLLYLDRLPNGPIKIRPDDGIERPYITQHPLVKGYFQDLQTECKCRDCRKVQKTVDEIPLYGLNCLRDQFLYNVSLLVADALSISLFESAGERPDLLVRVDNRSELRNGPFQTAVLAVLTNSADGTFHIGGTRLVPTCDIESLVDWSLALAGHDVEMSSPEHPKSSWAMSCFKGQAIYPIIFESGRVSKNGYLSLALTPGVLEFEGHRYSIVRGKKAEQRAPPMGTDKALSAQKVDRPLNSHPNISRLKWTVDAGDRILGLGVGLGPLQTTPTYFTHDPFRVISILTSGLVVERCSHWGSEPLKEPDLYCGYTSPTSPGAQHGRHMVSVVASDRADHLRFYSLASIQAQADQIKAIIRLDACLGCCLSVCRKVEAKFLVL